MRRQSTSSNDRKHANPIPPIVGARCSAHEGQAAQRTIAGRDPSSKIARLVNQWAGPFSTGVGLRFGIRAIAS